MILPALLSVLALAGAPQTTHVFCNPALSQGDLGLTFASRLPGPMDNVELGTMACGALLYASASPEDRAAIRRLNPGVDFDRLVGVGLQVALHEAEHVALDSTDECVVEKTARAKVSTLLAPFGATAEADATASDAALPPAYHGC